MAEFGEATEIATELALEDVEIRAPSWFRGVALTTLVFSVFTAAAALIAGVTAHEILVDRTEEILDATTAQSDRVSYEVLSAKHDILIGLGMPVDATEAAEVAAFEADAEQRRRAESAVEAQSVEIGSTHLIAAVAATLFAVAIAVTGLAAVIDRKWLWIVGGGIGVVAFVPFVIGVMGWID